MNTVAEDALRRIVKICGYSTQITSREVRFYEIAMEGLGIDAEKRRAAIEAVVQQKRDRTDARRSVAGGPNENP